MALQASRGAFQVEDSGYQGQSAATDRSPLLRRSRSKCCTHGCNRWTVAKIGAAAAGLGAGASLIALGTDMFRKSINENGPDGWTAWYDAFYYNNILQCIPHLGPAAFERIAGMNSILHGAKYVAIPVGYLAGKCMSGRWGGRLMKTCAVAGTALDLAGIYGTHFAVKNGVKDAFDGPWSGSNPLNESFIDSSEAVTEESGAQTCEVKISRKAIVLFASLAAQGVGNLLLGFAAGLYAGRKKSSDAVDAAQASSQGVQSAAGPRVDRTRSGNAENVALDVQDEV